MSDMNYNIGFSKSNLRMDVTDRLEVILGDKDICTRLAVLLSKLE